MRTTPTMNRHHSMSTWKSTSAHLGIMVLASLAGGFLLRLIWFEGIQEYLKHVAKEIAYVLPHGYVPHPPGGGRVSLHITDTISHVLPASFGLALLAVAIFFSTYWLYARFGHPPFLAAHREGTQKLAIGNLRRSVLSSGLACAFVVVAFWMPLSKLSLTLWKWTYMEALSLGHRPLPLALGSAGGAMIYGSGLVLSIAIIAWWLRRVVLHELKRSNGWDTICHTCGYSRTGLDETMMCPECGASADIPLARFGILVNRTGVLSRLINVLWRWSLLIFVLGLIGGPYLLSIIGRVLPRHWVDEIAAYWYSIF